MLKDKKIVLAVTGSIAAYRAADICRLLIKGGAAVTVLMTQAAQQFIGAATFAGLTGSRPVMGLFDGGFAHIDAAKDAEVILVAPATANIMAKLAAGIADDIVTASILAADCPIIICPAMNDKMWRAEATQRNLRELTALGYEVVGPDQGDLACGDSGWGRLAEVERVEAAVVGRVSHSKQLEGRRLLVSAGPTREYFDPVRFISNPSSGKMGYAVAREASSRGARVVMVSGPTSLAADRSWEFVPVESASQMRDAVLRRFDKVDAVIMTAAVADHRFSSRPGEKIDKDSWPDEIKLVRNDDILAELGKAKVRQFLVGFAAQTEDLPEHGREKLESKNLDLMVATKVGKEKGFGEDMIEAVLIEKTKTEALGIIDKKELAAKILDCFTTAL